MKPSALPLLAALLCGWSSSFAQTTPAPPADPSAASPPASPPPVAIPAAVAPNLHRIVRDLKSTADNIKLQGSFGAQLWLIANEDFFRDWRKPETPTIDPIDTAIRGQPLFTVIVFCGPVRDAKGQADVTYDLVVHRPDGTVYDEHKNLPGHQAAAPADERMLILGRSYINITIGPDDPAGKYTLEATVNDGVAKTSLALKKEFVVP